MPNDEMAKIVATNRSYGGRRSSLYRWMRARHDALAASMEADGVAWARITETLREAGLTDGTGKPPTVSRVRTTWYHVKQDVAAAHAKAEASRKPRVAFPLVTENPLPSPVPCEPRPPSDRPPAIPSPVQPAAGGNDDPIARLRRTLNERSGRY
jgi:hypothetical protein